MSLRDACWLVTAACALHVLEEYAFGWMRWVRSLSGIAVRPAAFWIINSAAILLGAACAQAAPRWQVFALMYASVLLINATFFHLGAFLWTRGRFSPGLVTAVLLFYPAGIWCFVCAHRAGVLNRTVVTESILLAALVMGASVALMRATAMRTSSEPVS